MFSVEFPFTNVHIFDAISYFHKSFNCPLPEFENPVPPKSQSLPLLSFQLAAPLLPPGLF